MEPLSTDVVDALVTNYIRFLSYIERRAGSRAAAEEIVQSAFARAIEKGVSADALDPELRDEVCACFRRLLPTLKPEYADILEKVDLEGRPVSEVSREAGITANNASVRLFRARAALRDRLERSCGVCATHGCLECSCGGRGSPG